METKKESPSQTKSVEFKGDNLKSNDLSEARNEGNVSQESGLKDFGNESLRSETYRADLGRNPVKSEAVLSNQAKTAVKADPKAAKVAPIEFPVTALTFDQLEAVKRGYPLPTVQGRNMEYYTAQIIRDLAARTRADLPTPELTLPQRLEIKKAQKVLLDLLQDDMFGKIKINANIPELRLAVKIVQTIYPNLKPEKK